MLRLINWNISYQGNAGSKIQYLKSAINELNDEYPCIIAMQEVTERTYLEIAKEDIFNNHFYSLVLRKPGQFEGRNRALGCLVICIGDIEIRSSSLINRALFPERALCVKVRFERTDIEVICFHSLTGVAFKKAKSAQFAALADYLNSKKDDPIILCCDLNEPEIDHLDLEKVKFFDQAGDNGKYASFILRPNGVHEVSDVYRIWLNQNQTTYKKIQHEQNNSNNLYSTPLAISHVLKGGIKKRYDYIMISPHWTVNDIQYRYKEAVQHGSDHALMVADIEWKGIWHTVT